MPSDPKPDLPPPPALPQRAAIYIAPDGSVHFGALFEGLVPVAEALGKPKDPSIEPAAAPGDSEGGRDPDPHADPREGAAG